MRRHSISVNSVATIKYALDRPERVLLALCCCRVFAEPAAASYDEQMDLNTET